MRVKQPLQSSGFRNRRKQKEIKTTGGAHAVGMFLITPNTKEKQPQATENRPQFDLSLDRERLHSSGLTAQEMLRSPYGLSLPSALFWKSQGLLASPKQGSWQALTPSRAPLSPGFLLSSVSNVTKAED